MSENARARLQRIKATNDFSGSSSFSIRYTRGGGNEKKKAHAAPSGTEKSHSAEISSVIQNFVSEAPRKMPTSVTAEMALKKVMTAVTVSIFRASDAVASSRL